MPVRSADFLEWSESHIETPDLPEFGYRNASSRAYYALFHAARQRLQSLGVEIVKIKGVGSHEWLIRAVQGVGAEGAEIGDDMQRIKRFRHFCDYDIALPLDRRKARKQIAQVRMLIERLSRL